MQRKENIEKNMEFLIKELQKEWNVSKETKHSLVVSIEDAKRIRKMLQQKIRVTADMLSANADMSFKESMKLCRENYITLRTARKLISGQEAALNMGNEEYMLVLDKEEYSYLRKLLAEA